MTAVVAPRTVHSTPAGPGTDRDRFSFVLVSDRTGGARPGVFEQGLAATDLLAPDFAIQLGDMIEGYSTEPAVIERQWDEMDALTDRLRTPLIRVPGNHDVANPMQRDIWQRRFGPTWFHFRHGDVLFCVLDTQDPPELVADQPLLAPGTTRSGALRAHRRAWNGVQPASLTDGQLQEWEAVLAEHRDVAWTVVCMHMPLWQGDHPAWRRIATALGDRPYTAFAGHVHNYRHERIRGRSHVRLGPTGGMIVLDESAGAAASGANADHITQVTMTGAGPVIANLALDGVRDVDGAPAGLPARAVSVGRRRG